MATRWIQITSLLSSSLLVSLASDVSSLNPSASLNSGTRKLFSTGSDRHENIDDGYRSHEELRYQNQDDLLPFGNFEELNNSGKEEAKITIQQFIDKLKQVRKQKQLEKKQKKASAKQVPKLKTIPDSNKTSKSKSPSKKNVKLPPRKPSLKQKPTGKKTKTFPSQRAEKKSKPKSFPSPSPAFRKKTKSAPARPKQPASKSKKTQIKKVEDTEKKLIDDGFEDHFFNTGDDVIRHSDHHVHQHDHLHAHKAFHKHKAKHDHSHAHDNDHVHNHKHTHNHVHNHIHKHNEQHEHDAEHTHTEKHHHKHLEYIDGGGWKKRSDQVVDDNVIARSDDAPPSFEPFIVDDSGDKLEERSGEVITEQKDVEHNLKGYLRKYIEFYKSVTDDETNSSSSIDIDRADERNDRGDATMGMTNEKNAFPDKTFVLDGDNDYNHRDPHRVYRQEEGEQYRTEILPNYEKHSDGHEEFGVASFDAYMEALSDQFPEFDDDPEYDEEQFLSFNDDLDYPRPQEDIRERGGQWEPVLQDLQIAFYDLEPDWQPEHFEEIKRRFSSKEEES